MRTYLPAGTVSVLSLEKTASNPSCSFKGHSMLVLLSNLSHTSDQRECFLSPIQPAVELAFVAWLTWLKTSAEGLSGELPRRLE